MIWVGEFVENGGYDRPERVDTRISRFKFRTLYVLTGALMPWRLGYGIYPEMPLT
jgi:hypothetical protein